MSKNKAFIFGMPAVLLAFALVLSGCDTGTGGGGGGATPPKNIVARYPV
jgi:hypothetical protein